MTNTPLNPPRDSVFLGPYRHYDFHKYPRQLKVDRHPSDNDQDIEYRESTLRRLVHGLHVVKWKVFARRGQHHLEGLPLGGHHRLLDECARACTTPKSGLLTPIASVSHNGK